MHPIYIAPKTPSLNYAGRVVTRSKTKKEASGKAHNPPLPAWVVVACGQRQPKREDRGNTADKASDKHHGNTVTFSGRTSINSQRPFVPS